MNNIVEYDMELCVPDLFYQTFSDYINNQNILISKWTKQVTPILHFAKIHIVLVDTEEWVRELLVKAILNMGDDCNICKLYLLGFSSYPDEKIKMISINLQPLMGLLFEGFHVDYNQLPLCIEDIMKKAYEIINDKKLRFWTENYKRIKNVLEHIISLPYLGEEDLFSAWCSLDSLSGGANRIKREEHDVAVKNLSSDTFGVEYKICFDKILNFQTILDHYYLAISRKNQERPYVFIAIEDNVNKIDSSLEFISNATDDVIYVTKSGDVCHKLYKLLKDNKIKANDWGSLGIEYKRYPMIQENPEKIVPDCILVDLILNNTIEDLEGEDVIKRLQDNIPSLPIIVVTKSEEPDVITRCVKLRGADRVVPKRRLLRLPYTYRNYLQEEISPLLDVLDEIPVATDIDYAQPLSRRMIGAYRTWNTSPGILWHGEKTMHAVEHSLEHSKGLWKLANELLVVGWKHINKEQKYTPKELFRFFMSIWLHDIGSKGSEGYQMADQVRERHSWISGELLHRNPELYMLKRGEEADVIELLCAYHQSCAPFWKTDKTKDTVKGLFHQSLEEIELASQWNLMEWAALLRLLDAIDHNWRRVGSKQLYESKKATIAIDSKYYRERADVSADARRYADWLDGQDEHMKRHMSVMNVTMKTKHKGDELLFWPEFEFASRKDAEKYLGEIGCYVLKEWFASGTVIEERMKMRLPKDDEIETFVDKRTYGIYEYAGYRDKEKEIQNLKTNLLTQEGSHADIKKEIQKLENMQKEKAWEVWGVNKEK